MRDFFFLVLLEASVAGLQRAISPTHFARAEQNRKEQIKANSRWSSEFFFPPLGEKNGPEPISKKTSLLWFLW